jgi:type II secretory pathway pseudopilin PulG
MLKSIKCDPALRSIAAFSLVEVTLALGIAAFCLIALFGLMPVGMQTNRNATSQTRATNILSAVIADLRTTAKTAGTWTGTSPQFCIPLGTATVLYFDSEGRCSGDLAGTTSPCGVALVPPLQPRYQLNVTFPSTGNLTYADLKARWPPTVVLTNPTPIPSGSVEMFVALDRR